ncbi:MAG: ATP-dependent sacrificial sulfur transferase LarE [Actinobacteria bacterium]|nr:ATP-dependent sacrificial sulfur transferase LarE [Actinomycetota bacterium]
MNISIENEVMATVQRKFSKLISILKVMDGAIIAYSGGVDSSLLLKACVDVIGERTVAVIADSPTMPRSELKEAICTARSIGVDPLIIKTDELSDADFSRNYTDRCYHCKTSLFGEIKKIAVDRNITNILYGGNLDDDSDYRPGIQAAKDRGARAPLREAGLKKAEIRLLSKKLNLDTWDKPAQACLSSRIPYGVNITMNRLQKIEETENIMRKLGFKQNRARLQDDYTVRIEIEKEDFHRILDGDIRQKIVDKVKKLGFTYITLDLEGFRSGSMNEILSEHTAGERRARDNG